MKIRNKNPVLRNLIAELEKQKEPVWKAVARGLNRPRRIRFEVGLNRLQRYAKPNENIVVPGVVVGLGEISKPITVAALRFTADAKAKIESAKGRCLSIQEMIDTKPKRVRILG